MATMTEGQDTVPAPPQETASDAAGEATPVPPLTEQEMREQHSVCTERLKRALGSNKRIKKLLHSIEELGCELPPSMFTCRPCAGDIRGGFSVSFDEDGRELTGENRQGYQPEIVMCENAMFSREVFENTLVHELVHAYDRCRSKAVFSNCEHHACTEVRAASLSGECNYFYEMLRGHFNFSGQRRECARRRAVLSVEHNPHCVGKAVDAVDAVFEKCYADKSPFTSLHYDKWYVLPQARCVQVPKPPAADMAAEGSSSSSSEGSSS